MDENRTEPFKAFWTAKAKEPPLTKDVQGGPEENANEEWLLLRTQLQQAATKLRLSVKDR
ncbi:hypothetical protein [Shouchella shacheensis]|uniref:hypothetical protein n=1 Tax=Shouchella shacheensis TaxID=1649580 RepID=UPI0007404981|nr:hypothetical protein [Shouchella shacheensis]